jgi:hypothetical protein
MKLAEEIAKLNGIMLVTEPDLATALLETPTQVERVLEIFGMNRKKYLDVLQELTKSGPIKSEWCSSAFID